jgi:hypothetical protein
MHGRNTLVYLPRSFDERCPHGGNRLTGGPAGHWVCHRQPDRRRRQCRDPRLPNCGLCDHPPPLDPRRSVAQIDQFRAESLTFTIGPTAEQIGGSRAVAMRTMVTFREIQ